MGKLYLGNREITPTLNTGTFIDEWGSDLRGAVTVDNTFICAPYKCYNNRYITSFSAPNVTAGNFSDSFYDCENLVTVNGFENLTDGYFYQAFTGCKNLINVPDFNSLIETGSCFQMFYNCTSLVTAPKFDNLETINEDANQMFGNCLSLTTPPTFAKLKTISCSSISNCFYGMFYSCRALTELRFPMLDTILGANNLYAVMEKMCTGCTSLTDIYFNALKTTSFTTTKLFFDMLYATGTNVVHTVHFPSNVQAQVEALSSYPLFGGTSGYVVIAFDLPATE